MGRHGHRLDLVVGDVEQRRAGFRLDALQFDAQVRAELRIERAQRLVHQEYPGIAHQRTADGDTLHLAARKRRRLVLQLVGDLQDLGNLLDLPLDRRLRRLQERRFQGELQVLADGEVRIERILLEHHGDIALGGLEALHRPAVDVDLSAVGNVEAGDHAQRRRLARARRAEQDDEGAVRHRQRDIVEGDRCTEPFRHVFKHDLSHGRALLHCPRK